MNAAVVMERWSSAVLPAEVRGQAQEVSGDVGKGGKASKAGKGKGSVQTKNDEKGKCGGGGQREDPQPTGRKPTRFRIDDDSETEGGAREAGGGGLGMGKKRRHADEVEEDSSAVEEDVEMDTAKVTEPMQIPSQPRRLLVARQRALQKKKEELQKGKGVGSGQGIEAAPQEEGREGRRLRKVEDELQCNGKELKAAGGAHAGNLKVALWREGKGILRTEKRLKFLEAAIEEDEEAIEEVQKRWRKHTVERDEVRKMLRTRKARHAHLATELAGEAQTEAEEILGKLESAMRSVEEAFAANDAARLDANAIHEILTFCRRVVPPKEEIDEEKVLDYRSLESSSSSNLTQSERVGEAIGGGEGRSVDGGEGLEMVVAKGTRSEAFGENTAEGLLEEALAVHQAECGGGDEGQKVAGSLPLTGGVGEDKTGGESSGARACSEERRRSETGKRQKVDPQVGKKSRLAEDDSRTEGKGCEDERREPPGGRGTKEDAPQENCRACNDVLFGSLGQYSCECGAPVCEACDGCNQCLRCLQHSSVRAAQKELAVDVRGLREKLRKGRAAGAAKSAERPKQRSGRGRKAHERQRSNSRSPRRDRSV